MGREMRSWAKNMAILALVGLYCLDVAAAAPLGLFDPQGPARLNDLGVAKTHDEFKEETGKTWIPGTKVSYGGNAPQRFEKFMVRKKGGDGYYGKELISKGDAEYFITMKNRSFMDGGTAGAGGLFKLQFIGTKGTTAELPFARGPSKGNYIFRKTLDGKDVGDITGVKLIRDDLVKNIMVWDWSKVDVTHYEGGTDTYNGAFGSVSCD